MATITKSTQPFTAQRITLSSPTPYDTVLSRLEGFTKREQNEGTNALVTEGREAFERDIESKVGEVGFKFFGIFPHSTWFQLFAPTPPPRFTTYILGNPLIARTMIEHDLRSGLQVPVRIILLEDPGKGTSVVYDLPSSIVALPGYAQGGEGEEKLRKAAQALDTKLERIVRDCLAV